MTREPRCEWCVCRAAALVRHEAYGGVRLVRLCGAHVLASGGVVVEWFEAGP